MNSSTNLLTMQNANTKKDVRIMEAIEAIMTRRSVRKFADRQIPDAVLEKNLKAGTYAPSALGYPAEKAEAHDKHEPNVTWVR